MTDALNHLAKITPVDRTQSARVVGVPSLLLNAFFLFLFQSGWVVLFFTGLFLLGESKWVGGVTVGLALAWLGLQFALVFMYPEWPLNRWLAWRLRQSVYARVNRDGTPWNDDHRVVELVPRDRWRKLSLDTATDLMLIHVGPDGVRMDGDRHDYELPRESILSAEWHSNTPPGWLTATHMAIIVVRTNEGPIELPISFRDHRFGSLRQWKRREQTMQLVSQINEIACGQLYLPPTAPVVEPTAAEPPSSNPYQTPSLL